MNSKQAQLVGLLALGGLGYAWLSGGIGRLWNKGSEDIRDVIEGLPPRIHKDVPQGVYDEPVPAGVFGSHEGWFDSWRIEEDSDVRAQAGTLIMSRTTLQVDDKAAALVGDPVALLYFARAVAALSLPSPSPVRLERQPYSPVGAGGAPNLFGFGVDDAYRGGYGFAFRSADQGRRVVRRLMSTQGVGAGVAWHYMGQSHYSAPGNDVVNWVNLGATNHYEVFLDRIGEWV